MIDLSDCRRVDVNDLDWLAVPGEYVITERLNTADRARLNRLTRKHGNLFRSSRDVGFLRVTILEGTA